MCVCVCVCVYIYVCVCVLCVYVLKFITERFCRMFFPSIEVNKKNISFSKKYPQLSDG